MYIIIIPVSFLVWLLSCLILCEASLCLSALDCITSLEMAQSEGAYLVGLVSYAVAMIGWSMFIPSVKISKKQLLCLRFYSNVT